TVCVVGKIRDLILQLSKSSIYSTKPLLAYLVMAKQVIPTASQCKIGTYVERDIHTPEEKYEVFGHWCRRFYRLPYRAAPAE
ncbi:hypothetical protein RAF67_24090, partial [Klebsiella pneumoniae]